MRFLTFLSVAILLAMAGVNALSVNKLGRARLVSSKEAMDSGAVSYVETTQAPAPAAAPAATPAATPVAPVTPAPAAPGADATVIIKKKGGKRRRNKKGGGRRRASRRANAQQLLKTNEVDASAPLPRSFKPVPVLQDGKVVKADKQGYFTIKQNDAPRVSKKKFKVKPVILLETEQPAAAVAAANSKTTQKQASKKKDKKKDEKKRQRRRRRASRRADAKKLLKANELDAASPLPRSFKAVTVIDATGKAIKPFDGDYHLVDQGVPKVDASVYKVKPVILLETGETRSAVLRPAKVVAADGHEIQRGAAGYTVNLSSTEAPKAAPQLDAKYKKVKIDPSATVMIELSGDNKKDKKKAEKKKEKKAEKKKEKARKSRLDKFNRSLAARARKLRRETKKRWSAVRVLDASGKPVNVLDQGYTKFDDVPRVTSPGKFKPAKVVGPDGKPVNPNADRHVPFIKVKTGRRKGKYVRPAGASFMEVSSASTSSLEQHVSAAHMVAKQLEAQKSHTNQVLEKMQFHSQRLTDAIQQAEAMDQSLAEVSAVAQAWNEQKNTAVTEASHALNNLATSIQQVHDTQDQHSTQLHELSSVLDDFAHAPQPVAFAQIQSYVTEQLSQAIASVSNASPAQLDKQVQDLTNKMEHLTQLLKNKQN